MPLNTEARMGSLVTVPWGKAAGLGTAWAAGASAANVRVFAVKP
jgi:hypothetical protein